MGALLRALIVEDWDADAQLVVRELRRHDYEVEYERVENAPGDGAGTRTEGLGYYPV